MRMFAAPAIAFGLGVSLRWAHDLPWDQLLGVVVAATIALWLTAVAVTLWCLFAPCGERDRLDARALGARRPATSLPSEL